jgi:hypothetical protein
VHRRRLGTSNDVERNRLTGIAAKAPNLKVWVSTVDRIADRRGWLSGAFVAEHSLVPRHARKLVGLLARELSALSGHLDLGTEEVLARLRGHLLIKVMRQRRWQIVDP